MGLPRLIVGALALAACADASELATISAELRPDTRGAGLAPPTYERGVAVEHLDSANFRIHYARTGQHRVAAADLDLDGTPDAVQTVASEYERVLAHFRDALGFRVPRSDLDLADENGGDGRFDVYLLDFPNSADGAFRAEGCNAQTCSGYMLQENDFNGRNYPNLLTATRILASHELFHAVQHAYRIEPSVVFTEATAVWASEVYDPSLPDFEGFLPAYFARPERSLLQEPSGPPDSFSYGAGLFFVMVGGECGDELVRASWEELASTADSWAEALDRVLQRDCGQSLANMFVRFARYNLRTGSRASDEGYARAAAYPEVAERTVTLPYRDELLRSLPLSTHYFVAEASGPIAIWASSGEVATMLAIEASDGTLREVQSTPANEVVPLDAAPGERIHAALVDGRSAGSTLRLALCLGSPAEVAACAQGVVPVEPEDASVPMPTLDAAVSDGGTSSDAGTVRDASVPEHEAGTTVTRDDGGCSLASGDRRGLWLLLALVCRRKRR